MDPIVSGDGEDLEAAFKNAAMAVLEKLRMKSFEGEGTPIKEVCGRKHGDSVDAEDEDGKRGAGMKGTKVRMEKFETKGKKRFAGDRDGNSGSDVPAGDTKKRKNSARDQKSMCARDGHTKQRSAGGSFRSQTRRYRYAKAGAAKRKNSAQSVRKPSERKGADSTQKRRFGKRRF